jgi:pilus assembly protein CpaE
VPASRILLVESHEPSRELIVGTLTAAGHQLTIVEDVNEAFRRAADHQLVIVDVVAAGGSALALCREIRQTPSLAAIPVLCISQTDDVEEKVAFLEAGADDVMVKPLDQRELDARVEALLLRFQRTRGRATATALPTAPRDQRRTITVFSPKGGAGTTTIAVNVAVAAAERHPDQVCLVDLDLQAGHAASHLDLRPGQTIADLVRDSQALTEAELLRTYAIRHDSGLHLLAAPAHPELAGLVEAEAVNQLLTTASNAYPFVVIDGGSTVDERAMTAFERADGVVFAVTPEFPALKSLHELLQYLTELGSVGSKALFVLNRIFARDIVKPQDIEGALGTKVAVELPYDPFVYLKAVNEGVPVVIGARRSAPAERLVRLAETALGLEPADTSAREARPRGSLLGGLLRRT